MTFAMFTFNFGGIVILSTAFPPADAKQTIGLVSPNVALRIRNAKTPCQLPRGTYLFGYDLNVRTDQGEGNFGRICRDILNGGWVWASTTLDKKGGL